MATNIFIIDKDNANRIRINCLLRDEAEINVLGSVARIKNSDTFPPETDVILLELDGSLQESLLLMKDIFIKLPASKIVFLSDRPESPSFLRKLMEGGAVGYFTKNAGKEELVYGIEKVQLGGLYICTAFTLRILSQFEGLMEQDFEGGTDYKISDAEHEVLALIAEGHTNRDIAQKLMVSVRTIETRRQSLLEKTDTTNTATLIRFAVKAGLVT